MQFQKAFLLSILFVVALLSLSAEAKHHKKHKKSKSKRNSWQRSVHHKCKQRGQYTVAVGGEKITTELINAVDRASAEGVPISLVINGRSLRDHKKNKHYKRNVEFVSRVTASDRDVSIIVLPYNSISGKSPKRRARDAIKQYARSAHYIRKVLQVKPLAVYVPRDELTRVITKRLIRAGYIVIGHTTQLTDETSKDWKKSSLIVVQHPTETGLYDLMKQAKHRLLKMVPLRDCIGELPMEVLEQDEEQGDENVEEEDDISFDE